MTHRIPLLAMLVLLLVVMLAACTAFAGKHDATQLQTLRVAAQADANEGAATQISVVLVYDIASARLLPDDAGAWFAQGAALRSALANTIDVVELQVPPAANVEVELPSRHAGAVAVHVYANYGNPAARRRLDLGQAAHMLIRLRHDDVVVEPEDGG